MPRKRRKDAPTGQPAVRLRDARFAALKHLKPSAAAPPEPATADRDGLPQGTAAQAGQAESDASLFRASVGEVTPLRDTHRATIERPRPSPQPRPKAPDEPEAESAPRRAPISGDGDIDFTALMHDVAPLPPSGVADLDATRPAPDWPSADAVQSLDPEDVMAWLSAGTTPLKNRDRADVGTPPPVAAPRHSEADERAVLQEALDPFSLEDRLDMGDEAVFLRTGLPRRILADLRRGRWVVQGEIDLHGMTRDEARLALGEFLAATLQRGQRCVRVVHGKGLGSPGQFGVLKHLSRGWLAQREEILAFCQTGAHEGGSGALRVLLRAPGKAGNS